MLALDVSITLVSTWVAQRLGRQIFGELSKMQQKLVVVVVHPRQRASCTQMDGRGTLATWHLADEDCERA